MCKKNLMIIDPSLEIPEIESYNELALKSSVQTTYHLPAINDAKSIKEQINNISGLILMGSAASVHDNFNWMKDIELALEAAINKKVPILGICFGHQFIGNIFGAKIDFLWGSQKKQGLRKVKIIDNSLLEGSFEDYLIFSHNEGVINCPNHFSVFGSSSMVEIEAMSHKYLPIWSFQTHIESSKSFAKRTGIRQIDFEKTMPLSNKLINAFFEKITV